MVTRTSSPPAPLATPGIGVPPLARILGIVGMIGSPFLGLEFASQGLEEGSSDRFGATLGLIFTVGWFCNALGLLLLGVTGRRLPARILLWVELIGVVLASLFQVYEIVAPGSDSLLYTITDIAWPLSMVVLLISGIVAIVARRFDGWLRFTPAFAAAWLPLGLFVYPLLGEAPGLAAAGLHTAIGWFLIGYAIFRGGKLSARA